MQITTYNHMFHPEEQVLSINNSRGERVHCIGAIFYQNEIFLEYQKSLFEEFFADVQEQLDEDVSHSKFKKRFEIALQEFNIKLSTFAEKVKQDTSFSIKGFLQIIIDNEYLCSLIGPVGVVILRKGKLAYMMSNDVLQTAKISNFADIIEGDVRDKDSIIIVGLSLETYLDNEDMTSLIEQSQLQETTLLDEMRDLLLKRVDDSDLTALYQFDMIDTLPGLQGKIQSKITASHDLLKKCSHNLHRYRHELLIFLMGIGMTWLGYWAVTGFLGQQQSNYVDVDGEQVNVTVKEIQQDIQAFDNIATESDEKLKKYQEIQQKISILESQKKQQFDVVELKKILEQKYFKGFNTTLFSSLDGFGNSLYQFSDQEKTILGDITNLFWKNGIFVAGSKGILLNAINQSARGTLVEAPVGKVLNLCRSNLKKDGFYCQDATYQLYNTNRQGFSQLSLAEGSFPIAIKDMQTYLTKNLFMLVEDKQRNQNGVYLLKYQPTAANGDVFTAPSEYIQKTLVSDQSITTTGNQVFSGQVNSGESAQFPRSSLAVDGSFLMWNSDEGKLYQYRRPGQSSELSSREVPMAGGNSISKQYSKNTRVITSAESKYVYLFDPELQSFIVYRSLPLKNNEAVNSSYKLQYFYSFKFSLGDVMVKDVFVRDGEKPLAYFLTSNGIYEVRLYEFVDQYTPKN